MTHGLSPEDQAREDQDNAERDKTPVGNFIAFMRNLGEIASEFCLGKTKPHIDENGNLTSGTRQSKYDL